MPKILLQLAAAALVFSSFGQIVVTAKLRRPIRTANKFRHWVEHDALDPIPINTTYISHSKNATFEQLIQHEQPKLGTFPQRYIYNTKYWKGPGSPIVFVAWGEEPIRPLDFNFTPRNRSSWAPGNQAGMTNASRIMESLIGYQYFSQSETSMVLAEKIGAAVVILEHRYFGESVPVRNLSTANMRYNSIENAIADGVNFARNARLPFDPSGRSHAPQTPWVIMGGSMGGALASWTEFVSPGTFWAYWASSATVEGASSWAYTIPILEHMPKNCSRDVSRVIDHMDKIGRNGTKDEIKKFQAMFGLESIEHFGDFVR
jgi:hypothetical protein